MAASPKSGPAVDTARDACTKCDGTGWVTAGDDSDPAVRRCDCYREDEVQRRLDGARIPLRYQAVTRDNFDLVPGMDGSLGRAKEIAEEFVESYPDGESGLLFIGTAGVGKTHLAVAVLRQIVAAHNVRGLFVDYRDLLRSIQDSYNPVSETSELEILRPVLSADLLLLDELGTRRPTAWVQDTVTHILNDRYKQRKLTLITTNFRDEPEDPAAFTLEDRIGPYARSRLYEMCRNVPMYGDDFRKQMLSASHRPTGSSTSTTESD